MKRTALSLLTAVLFPLPPLLPAFAAPNFA
jgi:hypothetical protein